MIVRGVLPPSGAAISKTKLFKCRKKLLPWLGDKTLRKKRSKRIQKYSITKYFVKLKFSEVLIIDMSIMSFQVKKICCLMQNKFAERTTRRRTSNRHFISKLDTSIMSFQVTPTPMLT